MRRRPVAPGPRAWLAVPGSLSLRLARAWGGFAVQVLRQGPALVTREERERLRLAPARPAWVREVRLHGPGGVQVLARSVCALAATHGAWRALRGLGRRPLAALLYERRDIRRSALRAQPLGPRDPHWRALRRRADRLTGTPGTPGGAGGAAPGAIAGLAGPTRFEGSAPGGAWQRWSVFERRGQRLLVSEHLDHAACHGWARRRP